jgi:glycosyltransferase involved in cell wall biosynthesis
MRLLVVSARSPFETITGAAHNHRALVAGLTRRGVVCHTLAGSRTAADDRHLHGHRASSHAVVDTDRLLDAAAETIEAFAPDVVMIWGRRELADEVVGMARSRGIPTVHQIRTPSHYHVERLGWDGTAAVDATERAGLRSLRLADLVLVPSAFMADYWAARLGVRPAVMHPVVVPGRVRVTRRGARFVTFVNPEPGKGLGMFWRLAAEAAARIPSARFLVVEGRWGAERMAQVGIAPSSLPNVHIIPNQRDVRRVWARTSVLLVPSVLPEGFGLVVQEAQLNGIPVIASRIGGLPEAANGGGVLIAPPQRCVADWARVPTTGEIRPWVDALGELIAARAARERARRRALRASIAFAPDRIIDGVAAHLRGLVGRSSRSGHA